MKLTLEHETYGHIEYNENFWTGTKKISINKENFKKINRKQFENNGVKVTINGSILSGIVLNVDGTYIKLSDKTSSLEYILTFIPLILIIIWGNSPSLCAVFPVVGGAIGGAISGGISCVGLMYMKGQKNIFAKIAITIVSCIVSFIVCYFVATLILKALA